MAACSCSSRTRCNARAVGASLQRLRKKSDFVSGYAFRHTAKRQKSVRLQPLGFVSRKGIYETSTTQYRETIKEKWPPNLNDPPNRPSGVAPAVFGADADRFHYDRRNPVVPAHARGR